MSLVSMTKWRTLVLATAAFNLAFLVWFSFSPFTGPIAESFGLSLGEIGLLASAVIDVDSKVVLHARLSEHRGTDSAAEFLRAVDEKLRVSDAEFLVDGMGYLTALARTSLSGELNYSDGNIVEKLFQAFTMRIGRFHETWNGSQASARRWLTAYTAYYNHFRSHQALDDKPPIKHVKILDVI